MSMQKIVEFHIFIYESLYLLKFSKIKTVYMYVYYIKNKTFVGNLLTILLDFVMLGN